MILVADENAPKYHNFVLEDEPGFNFKWVFLGILIGGLGIGGYLAYSYLKSQLQRQSSDGQEGIISRRETSPALDFSASSSALKSLSPESSKSSLLASVSKDKLIIKVLNGSRVAGQAGKVKDLLVTGGFENVTTDNSDKAVTGGSIVRFGTGVPESMQTEIKNLLKDYLKVINPGDPISDNLFGVEITTGK